MRKIAKRSLKIPSIRQAMLHLHEDLLDIDSYVWDSNFYDLTLLEKCVLASEDHRFFDHKGVDWLGVVRELLRVGAAKRLRGASTIEMQFVRTITGRYERSIRRKIREIFLSLVIQFRYSKIDILRSYLRIAFFGSGLKGVDAASNRMFRNKAVHLDLVQSAQIAAMLIYPRPLNPSDQWHSRMLQRATKIHALYIFHKEKLEK